MTASHPSVSPFPDVRTIAVLRGGGLGDLVFALPALDALRRTYPTARILLLGTEGHRALLSGRPGPVDEVEVLPAAPGVHENSSRGSGESLEDFQARIRALGVDLACQFHGGGRHSNPFLLGLGARHTVGTVTPDAPDLERALPYVYYQHEVARWLEVAGLAGASTALTEPRLQPTATELERGADGWGPPDLPLLVMHPGASDPRRRWPAERFAELARRAATTDGMRVVVIGSGSDADVAQSVTEAANHPHVISAADRLSLSRLVGVLSAAAVFVGNDSGPRHIAQAVGTPTVGLFWLGNAINGAPWTRLHNRIRMSWVTRCPVCECDVTQVGWTAERCVHDVSFLAEIPTDGVWEDLRAISRGRDLNRQETR